MKYRKTLEDRDGSPRGITLTKSPSHLLDIRRHYRGVILPRRLILEEFALCAHRRTIYTRNMRDLITIRRIDRGKLRCQRGVQILIESIQFVKM